jgi:hypothetical protein
MELAVLGLDDAVVGVVETKPGAVAAVVGAPIG